MISSREAVQVKVVLSQPLGRSERSASALAMLFSESAKILRLVIADSTHFCFVGLPLASGLRVVQSGGGKEMRQNRGQGFMKSTPTCLFSSSRIAKSEQLSDRDL